MLHGLIALKFWEESYLGPVLDSCWFVLTRVGLVLTRVRLVLTRVGLVLTRVRLVLTRVGLVLTRVRLVLIRVDSCWFVLTRVDLCWYSCIRIDLIKNFLYKYYKTFRERCFLNGCSLVHSVCENPYKFSYHQWKIFEYIYY